MFVFKETEDLPAEKTWKLTVIFRSSRGGFVSRFFVNLQSLLHSFSMDLISSTLEPVDPNASEPTLPPEA